MIIMVCFQFIYDLCQYLYKKFKNKISMFEQNQLTERSFICTDSKQNFYQNNFSETTTYQSQVESLPDGVPKGLNNLGETCYMNAAIQSLYSIDSFRNLILRSSHGKGLTSGE